MSIRNSDRKVSGEKLYKLMDKYGLRGTSGANYVAKILRMKPGSVIALYSRGILVTELELVEIHLAWDREEGKI